MILSWMSLPDSYNVKTETASLHKISALTYEVILPKYGQYLYNLTLICNPVLMWINHVQCNLELCYSNINRVSLCINNIDIISLYNSNTCNQVVNLSDLRAQYSAQIDFFRGLPIVTEALYKVILSVRMYFNHEPTLLPRLQYEIHQVNTCWHLALQNSPIYVSRSDNNNLCYYEGGMLWT